MAYTTINKSGDYFNTKLYTGTGSSLALTGIGHQPDFVWIKPRNEARGHALFDAVRGVNKMLISNANGAEQTTAQTITAFGSDGFTVGTSNDVNKANNTHVAWNWKANGSSTVTNNDGATTSYISHNSTAQFSIIKYTGTGSNTNIGHGLNGTPDCFITKGYSGATDWHLWNNTFTVNQRIKINSAGAISSNTSIFPTLPDATKIYLGGGGDVNQSGIEYICYAWKNVNGFSKSGSYIGNGNADGAFVYTGFKPAWVMVKRADSASAWQINDTKRDTYNRMSHTLFPHLSDSESSTGWFVDYVSNGFKIRDTGGAVNASGGNYIYMAFAEAPLVGSNNIPCTAR
jgi:hypothetical protein